MTDDPGNRDGWRGRKHLARHADRHRQAMLDMLIDLRAARGCGALISTAEELFALWDSIHRNSDVTP